MIKFLSKKSGHLKKGGGTDCAGNRREVTLHSEQFIVPGAHDFDGVFGARSFVLVLDALNFLKCLGHSGVEVPQIYVLDPVRSDNFCFSILCATPPLPIRVEVS